MKMKFFSFENDIEFNNEGINILEIANPKLFANVVISINDLINGEPSKEKIIITDNDEILDFSKTAMIVIDFINIDYNDKKIITKLYQSIENIYNIEYEQKQQFLEGMAQVSVNINQMLEELNFEFKYKEQIGILDYLKLISLKIDDSNYREPIERIFLLLDIIENFGLCKILILVNCKSYFQEDELIEIYKYAIYKKVELLLIENSCCYNKIMYEKKLIIDEDYDESVY